MMTQKRFDMRRATIVPTEVMSPYWREPVDLVAADLSPFGMYLISDSLPTIGEFIFCSFALSGDAPEYRLLSKVKRLNFHRRKTDRLRPGFGVEFLGVDEPSRNRIRTALRGLPPPIPSKKRIISVPKPPIAVAPKPFFIPVPKPSWDYPVKPAGIPVPKPTWNYPIH